MLEVGSKPWCDRRLAVLIALAASACMQGQDTAREASSVDTQRTTGSSDSLPIRRLEAPNAAPYRHNSGIRDSMFTAVRDSARWGAMWRRLTARHSPARSAPPIDFGKEMAVVAALGARSHGGYAIRVEAVIDRGRYLEAHLRRSSPGRRCGVTGAQTTPADVVVVPRREVEVRVVAHDHVVECGAR